jgi:hypothetical protein
MCGELSVETVARDRISRIIPLKFESQSQARTRK